MIILPYPHSLRKCTFLKRYKRFFVDVLLENKEIEAVHCANSGSMKSCIEDGADAYTLDSFNEARKLRHSLELLNLQDGLACLNTSRANYFVEKILSDTIGKIPTNFYKDKNFPYDKFSAFQTMQREVKFNDKTRFDFCLTTPQNKEKCWIEVKSVSLRLEEGVYSFPDAVTERGQKHLTDLMEAKAQGHQAWLFFVIMRGSMVSPSEIAKNFRVCHEIDPKYAALFKQAKQAGVRIALVVPEITINGFGLREFFHEMV